MRFKVGMLLAGSIFFIFTIAGGCECETTEDPPPSFNGNGHDYRIDRTETEPYTGPVMGRLVGQVPDRAGNPISGITVRAVPVDGVTASGSTGYEAITEEDGSYNMEIEPGEYVIHFLHDDYLNVQRRTFVEAWERVIMNARLKPRVPAVDMDVSAGGTIESEGVRVTFEPDTLVDSSGAPVSGNVDVRVTPVHADEEIDSAPGDFWGDLVLDGRGETPIISYGVLDLDVRADGESLELADGATVSFEFPVVEQGEPDLNVTEGDTIEFWWWDTETAMWVEEGFVTVEIIDGVPTFVGETPTLGGKNIDVPATPFCVTGKVVDCDDYPIPGAEVRLTGVTVFTTTTDRTGADGTYTITGLAAQPGFVFTSEARIRMGDVVYVETTPEFALGGGGCTTAPDLIFSEIRYAAASLEVSRIQSNTWTGVGDDEANLVAGGASFWDIDDKNLPSIVSCEDPPPTDTVYVLPFEDQTTIRYKGGSVIDVGNPIEIGTDAEPLLLFRSYDTSNGQEEMVGYGTDMDASLPGTGAGKLDITIRGASGAVPNVNLPGALHMPEKLIVTSPEQHKERIFSRAAGIPLRWEAPSGDSETYITVSIAPLLDGDEMVMGRLTDNGSFDIPADVLQNMPEHISLTLSRMTRRFESLPIGPAIELEGSSRVSMNVMLE